jgi:hypothetical protein
MLSDNDKLILSKFPRIKLSYENILHKKVFKFDVLVAIPEGVKCFVWFTNENNLNVCYTIELIDNTITKLKREYACFNSELVFGTILLGTKFKYNNTVFFTIENIYYYKGTSVYNLKYKNKLKLLKTIFVKDINPAANYNKLFVIFGLPIMNTNYVDMMKEIDVLPYKIKYVQYQNFENTNVNDVILTVYKKKHYVEYVKQNKRFIFNVKPDIQYDIYHLYIENSEYYDFAYIPDFKTSVMMNTIFRNIKENHNLDLLEESDNEDEFENENVNKYVYLNKEFNMECVYNEKFKKWTPIKVVDDFEKVTSKKELLHYKK